jgi:hypothetical protein
LHWQVFLRQAFLSVRAVVPVWQALAAGLVEVREQELQAALVWT